MTTFYSDSELAHRQSYMDAHGGSLEGYVPPPRKTRKKREYPEFKIQSAFVKLWRANCASLGIAPCLGFHINNGSVMGGGNAGWQKTERAIRGRLAKLAGVETGVCDWFLSVPVMRPESYGGNEKWWHGCYIEFKRPGQKVEPGSDQEQFIGFATARGYRCEVHTSAMEAWAAVLKYLNK